MPVLKSAPLTNKHGDIYKLPIFMDTYSWIKIGQLLLLLVIQMFILN